MSVPIVNNVLYKNASITDNIQISASNMISSHLKSTNLIVQCEGRSRRVILHLPIGTRVETTH